MGVRNLVVDGDPGAILVEDRIVGAIRLRDVGRTSEAAAAANAVWDGRHMPSVAIVPDGRVIRWEDGLVQISEVDLDPFPVIGRVTSGSEASPLRHVDGPGAMTFADAKARGILDADGRLIPWRRPRISVVNGCTITEVTSPNPSSAGPIVRSFMTFLLRMDDGSDARLTSYWHVPPSHALQAETALPGLTIDTAFEWLAAPLRRRTAADERVLCSGSLTFRCGGIPLVIPSRTRERLPASPSLSELGNAASGLPGELLAHGGTLRFEVLGAPDFHIELMAAEGGRLRLVCGPAGAEEARDVFPSGNKRFLADLSLYLATCGDLSVMAGEGSRLELPRYSEWARTHGFK